MAKANQTVHDATAKMAEAYQGLTSLVDANLQRQVDAVKARYAHEQAALETSKASEAAQITRSTALLTDALTQQTALRQKATADTLKLITDESQARIECRSPSGADRGGARRQRPARGERDPGQPAADDDAGARRVPAAHRRAQRGSEPASRRSDPHRGSEASARDDDR
jgi:phage-related minor tail protein